MPRTAPIPDWAGEDVAIIGGGHSLKSFDWKQLDGINTIGCNQAFLLGSRICNVCAFGDPGFWEEYQTERKSLEKYTGWVVTNAYLGVMPDWLTYMPRVDRGLCSDGKRLAWNLNTGAMAINLALIMGAARVFLFGYDMFRVPDGAIHWHGQSLQQTQPEHYARFQSGFDDLRAALPKEFPGRSVINVSDGASRLSGFPIVSINEALRSIQ